MVGGSLQNSFFNIVGGHRHTYVACSGGEYLQGQSDAAFDIGLHIPEPTLQPATRARSLFEPYMHVVTVIYDGIVKCSELLTALFIPYVFSSLIRS